MATLQRGETCFTLRPYELIGQSAFCSIVLDDEYTSGEHARLHWDGQAWLLKDLGSLNHTFVDGVALKPGGRATLALGNKIGFGNPVEAWELTSIDAPVEPLVMATPVRLDPEGPTRLADQAPMFAVGGVLSLPTHEHPRLTLWRTGEGSWFAEGSQTPLADGSLVTLDSEPRRTFRLSMPTIFAQTKPLVGLEGRLVTDAKLRFLVTPDLEHIELEVACGGIRRSLGVHRYNEILHALARLLVKQRSLGGDHDRDGWVHQDDVCKAVGGLDRERLNTEVFRARKGFAELGFVNPAQIIERRPRVGELRLGTQTFEEVVV